MRGVGIATFAALVAMATGCQSLSKEELGERIGAVTGALVGQKVADEDSEAVGAILGGAAGMAIGKAIGRQLDEREQEELAAQTQEALNREHAGTTAWESDRSEAEAEIRTGEVSYYEKRTVVKRIPTVKAVPAITIENKRYRTTADLNVRSGPSTRYAAITTLDKHEVVRSGGRTDNGWLMLVKDGVTVGYVHGGYVDPYEPQRVARHGSVNLDEVEPRSSDTGRDKAGQVREADYQGVNLDNVESSRVQVRTACRDVEIQVETEKGTEQQRSHACQKPDGVWELG